MQQLEVRATPTVNLLATFNASKQGDPGNDFVPPDTQGAVGPDRIVEGVNSSYTIFDKSGTQLSHMDMETFFGNTNDFDPIVLYDELAQRFVLMAIDQSDSAQTSHFVIAVSNNSSPSNLATDFTEKHIIDIKQNIGGADRWGDFPHAGYNADAYVVTFNMFGFGGGSNQGVKVLALNKATFLDANPATGTFFSSLRGNDFTMFPAFMHGSTAGDPMWLVESDNNGASTIDVMQMTNILSNNPVFTDNNVGVTSYSRASSAQQQGTGGDLAVNDARIISAAWRGGRLVADHTVDSNGDARVRWYEFDTNGAPSLIQQGEINPGPGIATFMGSINISAGGVIGMTYIQSSATTFMSSYVTGQNPGDPAGTMQTPVIFAIGLATYNPFDGAPHRTGDYSAVGIDPTDDSFWAVNEFADARTNDNWATAVGHFDTGFIGGVPPPSVGPFYFLPSPGNEGSPVQLFGSFTDQGGIFQTHFVTIAWGDGSADTVFNLQPAIQLFNRFHTYNDDGHPYTATITIINQNSQSLTGTADALVNNVAPIATINNVPATPADEGRPITFTAGVVDPGTLDGFTYLWRIKKNGVLIPVTSNTGASFTFTPDDNANWQVLLTVTDDDGGVGVAIARNFSTRNVAPTATLTNDGPKPSATPVTIFFINQVDAAADMAAGFRYSFDFNNDGIFEITDQASAGAQTTFASNGIYTVHARIKDKDGGFSDYTTRVSVADGGNGGIITTHYLVTGVGPGGGPHVKAFNPDGSLRFSFFAYSVQFKGGVRVASGDVNGDHVEDIITAAGPGGGPHIRVFDGTTGAQLAGPLGSFFAYAPTFTGGVNLAAGDINGDGFADIIVGPGAGMAPLVKVFSGRDGTLLRQFNAYAASFGGGVSVGAGDVNGDGFADIITAAGPGGGPHVEAFDGLTNGLLRSFFAFAPSFTGGVTVAAGDVNGDGIADLIAGMGAAATESRVRTFNGANLAVMSDFAAFPGFTGGIRVAADDLDGDGKADWIISSGPGQASRVLGLKGTNLIALLNFTAYDPAFQGGVYVG